MSKIDIQDSALHVEASIVGRGLGLEPSRVQAMMRQGEITSLCEHGVDEDEGRHRLTFFHKRRRFRLVVDSRGNILQRSTLDFGMERRPRRGVSAR